MEEIQSPATQTPVSPTPQQTQTTQSPSPWQSVAQAWEAIATRASNLVPASQPSAPTQSPTSSGQSGEVEIDPVVQGWLDQGVEPADINRILSVVPYTANCPAIAGDFEAMAILAADPDFDTFKNDPAYWQRLNESLQEEGIYNQDLPVSGQFQQEPLSFPPNFSTWGNQSNIHPFYQQDQVSLGRMLAEMGGDYDPGYRY